MMNYKMFNFLISSAFLFSNFHLNALENSNQNLGMYGVAGMSCDSKKKPYANITINGFVPNDAKIECVALASNNRIIITAFPSSFNVQAGNWSKTLDFNVGDGALASGAFIILNGLQCLSDKNTMVLTNSIGASRCH